VQCATSVSKVSAMITMVMSLSLIAFIICVLMMGVRNRGRNRLRVGAWRRHDARKLGHPEQSDQQPDKPGYRPQPIHRRLISHGIGRAFWAHRAQPSMGRGADLQHRSMINLPISPGSAKITSARSPSIPAPTSAGAPFWGPSSPESVLKRRFRSQKSCVLPSAVATM
jgi:hypothetical protein